MTARVRGKHRKGALQQPDEDSDVVKKLSSVLKEKRASKTRGGPDSRGRGGGRAE